jgi:hypothetical protein
VSAKKPKVVADADDARPGEETLGAAQQDADELNERARDAEEGGSSG